MPTSVVKDLENQVDYTTFMTVWSLVSFLLYVVSIISMSSIFDKRSSLALMLALTTLDRGDYL